MARFMNIQKFAKDKDCPFNHPQLEFLTDYFDYLRIAKKGE